MRLRNYNLFNTFAVGGDGRGTGGVAIIINNKCPSSQIHLKTNIQAVAVSVTLHRTISICSIYIPPRSKIVEKDLDEINYLLLFFFWAILMDIISFGVRTTLMIKAG